MHKEKCLENALQYQIMSAKEWRRVVFSDEKKFNFDSRDGFPKYWHAKNYPEENHSARHNEGGYLVWSYEVLLKIILEPLIHIKALKMMEINLLS